MESTYDAVVVGSGFGGGVTACRLAEQGMRVCVLERDQWLDVHQRLNRSRVFDSPFSDRVGISKPRFEP